MAGEAVDTLALLLRTQAVIREAEASTRAVHSVDSVVDPVAYIEQCRASRRLNGYAIVDTINWALGQCGAVLGAFEAPQVQYHQMQLSACLPLCFGAEWDTHKVAIMKTYGIEAINMRVAFSMPRGNGKTVATAAFLAALMYAMCDRPFLVACWAQVERSAQLLAQSTRVFLQALQKAPGARPFFMDANRSRVSVSASGVRGDVDMAVLMALPSTPESGRGLQPQVIMLEEAAHIPEDCIEHTILPLLLNRVRHARH
jgi:hypothetical protein